MFVSGRIVLLNSQFWLAPNVVSGEKVLSDGFGERIKCLCGAYEWVKDILGMCAMRGAQTLLGVCEEERMTGWQIIGDFGKNLRKKKWFNKGGFK